MPPGTIIYIAKANVQNCVPDEIRRSIRTLDISQDQESRSVLLAISSGFVKCTSRWRIIVKDKGRRFHLYSWRTVPSQEAATHTRTQVSKIGFGLVLSVARYCCVSVCMTTRLRVRVNVCNRRGGAPAGVRVTRSKIRAFVLRVDRRMRISYAPFRLRLIFITSFNSCICNSSFISLFLFLRFSSLLLLSSSCAFFFPFLPLLSL